MPTQDPESFDEGMGLFDILGAWWRARVKIFLLALAGLAAAAAAVLVAYIARPSHQETAFAFRLLFSDVEKGQYPNGTRFSPADIVETPVLEEVYRRNELEKYLLFDDFKESLAVIDKNPALDRLRRDYASRLDDRRLSSVDREKLEKEYESKVRTLQNAEFTLVARLGGRFAKWPATLTGKVMDDILAIWAERSRARGVFKFDQSVFSEYILTEFFDSQDDRLILLDRLRIVMDRILRNLQELSAMPGAQLVRTGERQVSLGEMEAALTDEVRYRFAVIEASIWAMKLYRNPVVTETYLRERLFRLGLETQAILSRAGAIEQALARYAATRPGAGQLKETASAASAHASGGGLPIPQIGESFLDRVVELSTQGTDIAFRQELTGQMIDTDRRLADFETRYQRYERMLAMMVHRQEKTIGMEEREHWRHWVDEQVAELLQDIKGVLNDLERLHQKLLARSLQPSMAYTVVEPLWQHRVSPVSMRTAGLVAGFLCAAYLGVVMIAIAWRSQAGR